MHKAIHASHNFGLEESLLNRNEGPISSRRFNMQFHPNLFFFVTLGFFCINPLLFEKKELILHSKSARTGSTLAIQTSLIALGLYRSIHNKNYQTTMQTKYVTYTSFNADYLAVPNNLLTHTHTHTHNLS